jgi:NHLM bacteriocin system ABC transporter ATP-binding protein
MSQLPAIAITPLEEELPLPIQELFLFHLRFRESSLVHVGANKPILLVDEEISWVVYAGHVDIFVIRLDENEPVGPRHFLMRVTPGQAIFGKAPISLAHGCLGLLAVGGQETRLLKLPLHRLQQLGQDVEYRQHIAALLDGWILGLAAKLAPSLPPEECSRLEAGQEIAFQTDSSICAKSGVLWVRHLSGNSHFLGRRDLTGIGVNGYWPVSRRFWLQSAAESKLNSISSESLLVHDPTWSALIEFNRLVLAYVAQGMDQQLAVEAARLRDRANTNRAMVEEALARLAHTLRKPDEELQTSRTDQEMPLLLACQHVGQQLGIKIVAPALAYLQQDKYDPLKLIVKTSRIQMRRVGLRGRWWEKDNGPLLAYLEKDHQPVALLRRLPASYELYHPVTGQKELVTAEIAELLEPFAYMFYRSFPDQPLGMWDLLKFGFRGNLSTLRTLILAGIAAGLLGLFVPVATGILFDHIIPNGVQGQLWQLSLALVVMALATALFQVTQNIAILRFGGRMGAIVQAAVWDRVLNLPVSFFRNYTAGDLGTRAMGISTIQETLSGTTINAIFAGIFSIFSLILLFYYSTRLALVATLLVLGFLAVAFLAGYIQLRYERKIVDIQGQISGQVLQTVTGIAKFRAAGNEGRAFSSWAKEFSHLKQAAYQSRQIANNFVVFHAGYSVFTTMVLFAVVAFAGQPGLSTGQFLAFMAAFTQFFQSALSLASTFINTLNIVPIYERARPILQTQPEVDEVKAHPGQLEGGIEVSHVSFRYRPDAPLTLKDVSIQIKTGEFVALVGSSGSGKTTLFRLLLGFETPTSGAIYYDRHDLAGLDIREVRNQIGVVLQDGQLLTGDIFNNIIGSSLLTLDDAWEAARAAALEEDIKQMPMGMHTFINGGGNTLSGGQRQRLLIARAIVHKPRILFFDEATSALDNHTQAIVSQSLENLQATRIVIAHRLSTIINADRIYVFQSGRVVQNGTYRELINQPGLFSELAKRQMT